MCGKGDRPEQFRVRLAGVAVDGENCVLAVGDREVKRFTREGRLDTTFAMPDAGSTIAADGESFWVGMQGRISHFDRQGKLLNTIDDPSRLGLLSGLVAKGGTLIAADATHRTIHLYQDGIWQREIGREANTRGFMIPNGILDLSFETESDTFLAAHSQKHRIERYRLTGEFVDKFGRFGAENPADFGGCCNPTNVAALPTGFIVVSEKAPPLLKVYTSKGQFVSQMVGVFDLNTKNIDLAADRSGRLYATDPLRCTIEVFEQEAPQHVSEQYNE
jgi:sugar lactone lactonase YvrE